MKNVLFYLGVSLLFTHELDAMPNQEWRVLPLTSMLGDSAGELAFVLLHIPLFALVIGFIASLNPATRARARMLTSAFLVLHAGLHGLFTTHAHYEFAGLLSNGLIYGAAVCGALYLALTYTDRRREFV